MAASFSAVQAADWPKRPLTMNVHASAGGGIDMIIRLVMSYVEDVIGQKRERERRRSGAATFEC